MSIIIKGMDMPKSCEECKWHMDFYIEEEQVGGLCTITEKDDKEKACPLIEIVTCKECKWCDDVGEQRALICNNELIDTDIHPNFFCEYGERRADEHTD